MAGAVNPYGDGKAADRIIRAMRKYFGITDGAVRFLIV
jgi:UDP-N-acetylglucosamine 2-epimerase